MSCEQQSRRQRDSESASKRPNEPEDKKRIEDMNEQVGEVVDPWLNVEEIEFKGVGEDHEGMIVTIMHRAKDADDIRRRDATNHRIVRHHLIVIPIRESVLQAWSISHCCHGYNQEYSVEQLFSVCRHAIVSTFPRW